MSRLDLAALLVAVAGVAAAAAGSSPEWKALLLLAGVLWLIGCLV